MLWNSSGRLSSWHHLLVPLVFPLLSISLVWPRALVYALSAPSPSVPKKSPAFRPPTNNFLRLFLSKSNRTSFSPVTRES